MPPRSVPWEHKPRGTFKLLSPDYSRRGAIRDIGFSAWLSCKAAINRLSIPWRLGLFVLALALPLNLIIVGTIGSLVNRADDAQRTSLLYAVRPIAAGVDAELGKYVALAESLARSPDLLDDNLDAFEVEARREFPVGRDVWAVVWSAKLLAGERVEYESVVAYTREWNVPFSALWPFRIGVPTARGGPPISCPTRAIQPMTQATLKAHRTGVEAPRCVSLAPNNNDRGMH
jgi:hypothetical protein